MASATEVLITESANLCDGEQAFLKTKQNSTLTVQTVTIEELVDSIDEARLDQIYDTIERADVELHPTLDLYSPITQYFAIGNPSLVVLFGIGSELSSRLGSIDPDRVHIGNSIKKEHNLVISDVCDDRDIPVSNVDTPSVSYKKQLVNVAAVGYLLLEQFLYILFSNASSDDRETLLLPSRWSSMKPVAEQAQDQNHEFAIVSIQSYINDLKDTPWNEYQHKNIISYLSFSEFWNQLRFYVRFVPTVLLSDRLSDRFARSISEELDTEFQRTASYLFDKTIATRVLPDYRFIFLSKSLIKKSSANNVVVGTLGPRGRIILNETKESEITRTHLPHSVATNYFPRTEDTTHFVSGELDQTFLKSLPYTDGSADFAATGRPYLYEFNQRADLDYQPERPYELLIATQPTSSREEFVHTVLRAVENTETRFRVRIKTHPNEDPAYYSDLSTQYSVNISVHDSALFEHLSRSDIVTTVNSNVGLEAMLLGIPTVSVNLDPKRHRPFPYQRFGPVDVLVEQSDADDWFDTVHTERLESISKAQREFVESSFQIEKDPSRLIVEALEDEHA